MRMIPGLANRRSSARFRPFCPGNAYLSPTVTTVSPSRYESACSPISQPAPRERSSRANNDWTDRAAQKRLRRDQPCRRPDRQSTKEHHSPIASERTQKGCCGYSSRSENAQKQKRLLISYSAIRFMELRAGGVVR